MENEQSNLFGQDPEILKTAYPSKGCPKCGQPHQVDHYTDQGKWRNWHYKPSCDCYGSDYVISEPLRDYKRRVKGR